MWLISIFTGLVVYKLIVCIGFESVTIYEAEYHSNQPMLNVLQVQNLGWENKFNPNKN